MPQDEVFFRRCRRLANRDAARALVLLWLHLRQHGNLETGLDRGRCEREAEEARLALEQGGDLPPVHPAAALRAVDEHLAGAEDLGYAPRIRRVQIPGEEAEAFLVIPRSRGWISRLAATQPGHLEFWMRRHQIVPGLHRGVGVEVWRPTDRLLKLLEPSPITFVAGGFPDGVRPDWNDSPPYRCHCLKDPATRWSSVEALLVESDRRRAAIVVLPELTLDAELRERLRHWLREARPRPSFALVVAGSFHEDDSGAAEGPGPRRNVARVFDNLGDEVLRHVKLRPMRAMPGGRVVDEDIEGGRAVRLIQAPFGLVAVAICLDFCDIGDTPVADLWRAVGPALMLVPSMGEGSTNRAHRAKARPLALQHATATLIASQHPDGIEALGLAWDRNGRETEGRPVLFGELDWTGK